MTQSPSFTSKSTPVAKKSNACHQQDGAGHTPYGTLYITATPIGNLADITLRALDTLKQVDLIACEDTRHSRKLLTHYGIHTPTISYHSHNEKSRDGVLIARLKQGENIALISDAGTPIISDPGASIVQAARAQGITVIPIPGACAAISALSASAIPSTQFFMVGFLPSKGKARKQALAQLPAIPGSLVLYEAPHRLQKTLTDLLQILGNRPAMLAREISKIHENFYHMSLEALQLHVQTNNLKGECVLVIGAPEADDAAASINPSEIDALLHAALQTLPPAKAAKHVAEQTGLARAELYTQAMQLKQQTPNE